MIKTLKFFSRNSYSSLNSQVLFYPNLLYIYCPLRTAHTTPKAKLIYYLFIFIFIFLRLWLFERERPELEFNMHWEATDRSLRPLANVNCDPQSLQFALRCCFGLSSTLIQFDLHPLSVIITPSYDTISSLNDYFIIKNKYWICTI